jgi:hypothetical protein
VIGTPHTIEIKIGDKQYKGIYQFVQYNKHSKEKDYVNILLSEPGGDFPKKFDSPRQFTLPKDLPKGVLLHFSRKK